MRTKTPLTGRMTSRSIMRNRAAIASGGGDVSSSNSRSFWMDCQRTRFMIQSAVAYLHSSRMPEANGPEPAPAGELLGPPPPDQHQPAGEFLGLLLHPAGN